MRGTFSVSKDICTIGFQTHSVINPELSVNEQLHRRKLYFRPGLGNPNELIKIIEWNSSLRIAFGWGFGSVSSLENVINDCMISLSSHPIVDLVNIISDIRCDWFGFVPFSVFDREYYKNFCIEDLVVFNNNLIDYHIKFAEAFSDHRNYRYQLFVKDERYRYNFFKNIKHNPNALYNAFHYYIESAMNTSGLKSIPRDIVDLTIGCYYLHHPEVFFESLEFNMLKGTVYEP